MCWVAKGYVQVHRSLKSDRFAEGQPAKKQWENQCLPTI